MNFKKALLLSVMSIASIGAAMAGPTNVPLTGTISFIGTIDPNTDPTTAPGCPLLGMNYGGGTLSHLGKTALVSSDCVTPGATGLSASNGKLTLTAANGDTVTGTYTGTFIPINSGAAFQFSNVMFSITGGSGRFSRAYGRGILNGTQESISGKGTITVDGTISY